MRKALTILLVVVATVAGATATLETFPREHRLEVGTLRLSVDPGHRGALDLSVPLVDWGARFPVVRLPARIITMSTWPRSGASQSAKVHAPGLAQIALQSLRDDPPQAPLVLAVGHTHKPSPEASGPVAVLNPGSVGGGGTGNLAEAGGDIGLARMTFTRLPTFVPRAADLVEIDPGDGEAQARRFRLDPAS